VYWVAIIILSILSIGLALALARYRRAYMALRADRALLSPIQREQTHASHDFGVMEEITQRKQQERERDAVLAVSLALRSANTREEILVVVLREIAATFDAVKAFYITPDPLTEGMNIRNAYEGGALIAHVHRSLPPGTGVAARVHKTGEPYVTSDVVSDPNFALPELLEGTRAVACVPLIAQEHRIGVFSIARNAPFSADDVRLLSALADMAANGLQRALYYEETLCHAANLEHEVSEQTRELRQAYEKLQELDLLKSKFVSDVSHELRTPVTNIGLYLKLIERKPEKQTHYLSVLAEESDRLENLVLDVLNLARLDIMPAITCAPVDLNKLAAAIVENYRHSAAGRNLELKLLVAEELPWVLGDEEKVYQIVDNLISNALNFTPAGSVTVRTQAQGEASVCLIIEDTGTGIYADDLPHVFDRFYRGKRDQVANAPGSGLGLSIVKELVELHNGTIEMASEVGTGTTVTVTFPAQQQAS
jgi:signal transduction histidine kinase